MNVEINHQNVNVSEYVNNLEELLQQEGFAGPGVAVAVNNRVIPKAQWKSIMLEEDMKITVIRAARGG